MHINNNYFNMKWTTYWIKAEDRRKTILSSEGKCHWCHKKANKSVINSRWIISLYDEHGFSFHLDHVIPVARWWKHTSDNLVVSCKECNLWRRKKIDTNDIEVQEFMKKINNSEELK